MAAGAPGVTDADAGVVIATSYLKGWCDVPLRNLLESTLHVPASIENDVRVAAIGENWRGSARGVRDFAFLAIGTGIAAGIFVNGQIVHGKNWSAGEVGYMLVPGTPEAAAKPGMPGSLESVIGGEGIKSQWTRALNGNRDSLPRNLNATELFDYARKGNVLAKGVLDRSARILAYAIYNISLVLNCSLFVLGGGVGSQFFFDGGYATRSAVLQRTCPAETNPQRLGAGCAIDRNHSTGSGHRGITHFA